jgi:hypothetical protein
LDRFGSRTKLGPGNKWTLEKVVKEDDADEQSIAEKDLKALLSEFLDSPEPQGRPTAQAWLDRDKGQRVVLRKFWKGMRKRHRDTLRRLELDKKKNRQGLVLERPIRRQRPELYHSYPVSIGDDHHQNQEKGGGKGFEVPAKKQQCTKITDPNPMGVRGSVTNFAEDQSRKVKG